MALMVQKTQFLKLGQEEYNAAFGDGTYEQMKQLKMMGELQGIFTKIKDQVVAIGIEFAPFIKSGLESVEAFLASGKALEKMKSVLKGLVTVAATLAGLSLAGSVARIVGSFASLGPPGIIAGMVAAAGTIALAAKARSMVNDGIADSSRGPFTITDSYGKMAMTAQGDSLAVSPNINQGGGSGDEKIISLLERLINRTGDVMLDGQKVGNVLSSTYRTISN